MATIDNGGNNNNGNNNNDNNVHGSLEGFQKSNLDREGGIPKTGLQNHLPSPNMLLSPVFEFLPLPLHSVPLTWSPSTLCVYVCVAVHRVH